MAELPCASHKDPGLYARECPDSGGLEREISGIAGYAEAMAGAAAGVARGSIPKTQ